jgi:hypothetical protein
VDIIVAEGGIQVVVPLLSIFQPEEPPNLREFVVNRSVGCATSTQKAHTIASWCSVLSAPCLCLLAGTYAYSVLCAVAMEGRRSKRRRASCWACWPSSQSTSMPSQTGAPCRWARHASEQ